MKAEEIREAIKKGETYLGIEFGSTRIKAVLISEDYAPIASGGYEWENKLEKGVWTYSLDDVWRGLRGCYSDLCGDVKERYGEEITTIGAIGISAMMHGYLPFDKDGSQLAEFRTWRNTMTGEAADKLSGLFEFNIPQRWSIAHLYQAILNKESHVKEIAFLTTLAGYVHTKLTGKKVLGVGDASGMFPIDSEAGGYDAEMLKKFDELVKGAGFSWTLSDILPTVLSAGEDAGTLTAEGALLLDESGKLKAGIPLCPPEGDAGTGMAATNSVSVRTGNVSAGTSIFAMVVLEKALSKYYPEIDMVTTPAGKPVAMVHCNNCTSDINAWAGIFRSFSERAGKPLTQSELYDLLFYAALEGDADCGGIFTVNYFSGEPVTGFEEGRPLLVRTPESSFTLANLMRANICSALVTLKIGMDILSSEKVAVDRLLGHGGLYKTKGVGQRLTAAAMNAPVDVMSTAGEGGAWGIALLASFAAKKTDKETLESYLEKRVFNTMESERIIPDVADVAGFEEYTNRFINGLEVERAAVEKIRG